MYSSKMQQFVQPYLIVEIVLSPRRVRNWLEFSLKHKQKKICQVVLMSVQSTGTAPWKIIVVNTVYDYNYPWKQLIVVS
jgi:hypothetical protein